MVISAGMAPCSLEGAAGLVLTPRAIHRQAQQEGVAMSEQTGRDEHERDSIVDARAIFALILLTVITAVYWVSHQ